MSSRIACWLHGHVWGRWSDEYWSDLVGNDFRVRWCKQCGARDRTFVGWHAHDFEGQR